jgi:hypothetical protein
MRNLVPLRIAGILSSVAFLTYGLLTHSYPLVLMEVLLLPINIYRLVELRRDHSRSIAGVAESITQTPPTNDAMGITELARWPAELWPAAIVLVDAAAMADSHRAVAGIAKTAFRGSERAGGELRF